MKRAERDVSFFVDAPLPELLQRIADNRRTWRRVRGLRVKVRGEGVRAVIFHPPSEYDPPQFRGRFIASSRNVHVVGIIRESRAQRYTHVILYCTASVAGALGLFALSGGDGVAVPIGAVSLAIAWSARLRQKDRGSQFEISARELHDDVRAALRGKRWPGERPPGAIAAEQRAIRAQSRGRTSRSVRPRGWRRM